MVRSWDFQRIYDEFCTYYKSQSKGESEYYGWLRDLHLNEQKPYGQAREEFRWAANMLRLLKEDSDSKYYGVIVGLPLRSMNGNVYRERDLIAAALSLKGKSPSVNHKDEFWLSPNNRRNRWGVVTVEDAKYEDGAVEAILKVPKTAGCPVCPRPGSRLTELIDGKYIVNVSLEGTNEGAFEFSDPPFTLLTSDVLPGIPLARIKPLEKIMVEALQASTRKEKVNEKTVIKAKIVEEDYIQDSSVANPPKPNVDTNSTFNVNFKGTTPEGMISQDRQIDDQRDQAKTVMGTPAFSDNTNLKVSQPPTASEPLFSKTVVTSEQKVQEPFAGYKDFADCVAKNSDKSNPQAYCGTIKSKAEPKEAAPTSNTGGAPSGGQSAPSHVGVTGGPDRSTPPSANWGGSGSLPPSADHNVVMGTSPGEIRVVTGNCPVESIEDRVARIKAESKAKNAEASALEWEQHYRKASEEAIRKDGQITELKTQVSQANERMEKAIGDMNGAFLERDKYKRMRDEAAGERDEARINYEKLQTEHKILSEKYQLKLQDNLALSNKATQANEDYLAIAKEKEQLEEALSRAKNEAKKITKITV